MLYKFSSSHTAIAAAAAATTTTTDNDDTCFTAVASKKDTSQLSWFVMVFPSLPLPSTPPLQSVQSEYEQIQPVFPEICVQLWGKSWLHHPPKGCQKICFCWCIVFSTFTYIEWSLDQMNRIIVFIINFSEQKHSFREDITMNSIPMPPPPS